MTTVRSLRDTITNALDFLSKAELAIYANDVAMLHGRVTWRAPAPAGKFLITREHATAEQYLAWAGAGEYSALLVDGSLLQLTYDLNAGVVVGHRLAYIPCPAIIDATLLLDGEPVADIVPMYLESQPESIALRSPVRFDFDLAAARPGHPASHFSINTPHCRMACVAPMHPYRFLDFVYRHFYPELRALHVRWFSAGANQHLGERVLSGEDGGMPHISWPLHSEVAA